MEHRIPITRTKVLVPRRRADLLSRQRLLEQMLGFLDLKLVIVAAPAGYGKTSLLVDFIPYAKMPACWFALDPLDQDLQRFIAHFIAAIAQRFPQFGRTSWAALRSSTPDTLDIDSIVSVVSNDVYENVQEHFLIVLDDYHLVEESKLVTYFINQFIQLSDENCHLIICSRTLLNLPDMSLLVAHSQVGGLSFEALAFSPEEIQKLWTQNFHSEIAPSEAFELSRQTEGWITGVLLTQQTTGGMLSDRLRRAKVAGIGLYDYLAQQVLECQPPEVQRFLLRTALLEEFDTDLCAEVLGSALGLDEDWDGLMGVLLHLNLFIQQVGEDHLFLRYHHLFRDFLIERMLRSYPEEAHRIELSQAQAWVRRGEWERAYEVFSKSAAPDELADLVEAAGPVMIARGRLPLLNDWLESLPLAERAGRPELMSLQGAVAVMRGAPQDGLRLLEEAVQGFQQKQQLEGLSQALTRRSDAQRLLGQYAVAVEDARQALDLAQTTASSAITADALLSIGTSYYYLGELQSAWRALEEGRQVCLRLQDDEGAAKISMLLGMVANALGQYQQGEKSYLEALRYYEATGNRILQSNLLNNLGVVQHQKGSYEAAANSFERAVHYAQAGNYTRLEAYSLTSIGDLYRDAGALEEALEAYRQARPVSLRSNERFLLFYLDLAEAILACLDGQPDKAMRLLRLAWQAAEVSGSNYQQNLVRLERGAASLSLNQYREAAADLRTAVDYFSQAGHRSELTRARFYLAAACHFNAEPAESLENLNQVYAALTEPGSQNLLATLGLQLREYLLQAQAQTESEPAASALLQHTRQFEKKLPALRRQLRQQTQAVPFGPPHIVIHTFGRIQVKSNNKLVTPADWGSQPARDLFLILAAHPDGLTREEAGLMLWPDGSEDDVRLRFKNTIYRLRRAVGKDVIQFDEQTHIYRFNHALDYEEDAETFAHTIEQARKSKDPLRQIAHLEAAARLYRGEYLPELELSWVTARRAALRSDYLHALLELAHLQQETKQTEKALETIQKIHDTDRCHEEAYQLRMQIHGAVHNPAAVRRAYAECCAALADELDVKPSRSTRQLYESLNH